MKYAEKYWKIILVIFAFSIFINPAMSFLLLGLAMCCFSTMTYISNKEIQKKGIERSGKIISYESDNEGDKFPIIEFETINGELISAKSYIYVSTDLIEKPVIILYHPKNPKKFIVKSEKEFNSFFAFILFAVSLGFVIIAICSLFGYLKL